MHASHIPHPTSHIPRTPSAFCARACAPAYPVQWRTLVCARTKFLDGVRPVLRCPSELVHLQCSAMAVLASKVVLLRIPRRPPVE